MSTIDRPFRDLCPEADERDAMTDAEFWERVHRNLGGLTPDDLDVDLDPQVQTEPCGVCGSNSACSYDAEGRALIHSTDLDVDR